MPEIIHIGIDIGAADLSVAILLPNQGFKEFTIANNPDGHERLIKELAKYESVLIAMEATGLYSLDVACSLSECSHVQVMLVNPRAAKKFHQALMTRSKTDKIDSRVLAQFAQRMPFTPWRKPSQEAFALRSIARRIKDLKKDLTVELNRLHALNATSFSPKVIIRSVKSAIRHLEKLIKSLELEASKLINNNQSLKHKATLLESITGIGKLSAIYLLAELEFLNPDIDVRQLVAYAGLDPSHNQSGSSVNKPTHVSKRGNANLRSTLYMSALVAVRHCSQFKAFYISLCSRGKKPKQALVAVMRKLLHAVFGVLKSNLTFNPAILFPDYNT